MDKSHYPARIPVMKWNFYGIISEFIRKFSEMCCKKFTNLFWQKVYFITKIVENSYKFL